MKFGFLVRLLGRGAAASRRDLVAAADALRDRRLWPEAVDAYRQVLARFPGLPAIWVQLGHALKEAGGVAEAEAAYRQALVFAPHNADGYVQLGHALKLQGRLDEAIAAYAQAVAINPRSAPALRELIDLGAGPAAGAARSHDQSELQDLILLTRGMRDMLERVERLLPDVASLNSIAIGQYTLFRALYRLPPPPQAGGRRRWGVVVVGDDGGTTALASLASLARSTLAPDFVFLDGMSERAWALAEQCGWHGFGGMVAKWTGQTGLDWLLVVADSVALDPLALAWFDWAATKTSAAAIYADEEWGGTDPVPYFKSAYDQFADPDLQDHAVLAVRGDIQDGLGIPALVDEAGRTNGVSHLARVLACRPGAPKAKTRNLTRIDPSATGRIAVIIPTRDGVMTLRPAIEALFGQAARPEALDLVVIDNGSVDTATVSYLAGLTGATVLREGAAFNWSLLNNRGAAATDADLLLFINDDVALQSANWDDVLRTLLAVQAVGVVGARLNYPDGALQHAGMVFGPNGRSEHEGVAVGEVPPNIAARWRMRRAVGAVTGAFMACRAVDFASVGGFDMSLPIWFGDVDFCLRLRAAGKTILFEPRLVGIHHESHTLAAGAQNPDRADIWDQAVTIMRQRWGAMMEVDPSFNPHFARTGRPFAAIAEPSIEAITDQLVIAGLQR